MTKEIQLTQGQVALVDDWWFDELNQYKWYAWWNRDTQSFYALRHDVVVKGKDTIIRMHRVVARTPYKYRTDHINHKTLDNQEANLRVCTSSQNNMNIYKHKDNTSGYKGVVKHGKNWQAQIDVNKKHIYLGTFQTKEEAAHIYDNAASTYFGEFAVLNFPKSDNK